MALPTGDGRDGMREVVELKAVSGCVADFGRIVAWAHPGVNEPICSLSAEQALRLPEPQPEGPVVTGHARPQNRLTTLLASGEQCGHHRDANAPAQIAHQIEDGCRIADLLRPEQTHRHRRQRGGDKAERKSVEEARPQKA